MFLISILQLIENTGRANNLIAQGIGMVGLIFAIISFQNNKRNLILLFLGMAQMCFIVHFALLGVWTASAMNVVGATRTFFFMLRGRKKWMDSDIIMYVFVCLFFIAGILSWQNWLSILPVMAMAIETIGVWQKAPRKIRFIVMIPRPMWITFNVIHRSYAGVMTEVFVITSLLTAIIRFDILPWVRQKNGPKKQSEDSLK
jgi:hypothetical protein